MNKGNYLLGLFSLLLVGCHHDDQYMSDHRENLDFIELARWIPDNVELIQTFKQLRYANDQDIVIGDVLEQWEVCQNTLWNTQVEGRNNTVEFFCQRNIDLILDNLSPKLATQVEAYWLVLRFNQYGTTFIPSQSYGRIIMKNNEAINIKENPIHTHIDHAYGNIDTYFSKRVNGDTALKAG